MAKKDLKKLTILESKDFIQMVRLGVENLNAHLDEVNDLNVFPVPDGDTGTNMKRTIETGYDVIKSMEKEPLSTVTQNLSKGMLLGARGNSGVILSQIFRGFSNGIGSKKYVSTAGLNIAFKQAVKQAYSAVIKPVEGTILTVIREAQKAASKQLAVPIYTYISNLTKQASKTVDKTVDMLDALKEAGVVDSGGKGLYYIFEGFKSYFEGGKPTPDYKHYELDEDNEPKNSQDLDFSLFNEDSELEYGYCTEFILQLSNKKVGDAKNFDVQVIVDYLMSVGESVVCFKDGTIVKTHVHTKDPGAILSYVRRWGEFLTLKIENMALQHNNKISKEEVKTKEQRKFKQNTTVVVAQGTGLIEAFSSVGADEIVNGKQTMNPSTEDFIEAFESLNTKNIIVLPNNSNIILTAEQARDIYKEQNKDVNVYVVKTKSIAQGYIACQMIQFAENNIQETIDDTISTLESVSSIEITTATRDTVVNSIEVKKDEYIGILDHNLVTSKKVLSDSIVDTISKIEDIKNKESLLLFFGIDAKDKELQKEVIDKIKEAYPNLEIQSSDGDQDVYYFIGAIY